jgi:phage terminase Nu1 subunit (DNA packaging protein)
MKLNIYFPFDSRMKEKYEHEIRELENSEKGLKDKYIDARTRLAESEAGSQNLKAMVTQMELQLSHLTKVSSCGISRSLCQNNFPI